MNIGKIKEELVDTYIKNDYGSCRDLYFKLCVLCGLHSRYKPSDYGWPWVYEDGEGLLQHAPRRKYIRGKKQHTFETLTKIEEKL